jgi:hypothetical protein
MLPAADPREVAGGREAMVFPTLAVVGSVRWLLETEPLDFAVIYGSQVSADHSLSDIDILAVSRRVLGAQSIRVGRFDLTLISPGALKKACAVLDPPLATEPLLSGKMVFGSRRSFASYRKVLTRTRPTEEVTTHMLNSSIELLNSGEEYRANGELVAAALSLSFASSYAAFALWYARGRPAATLDTIATGEMDLERLVQHAKDLRSYGSLSQGDFARLMSHARVAVRRSLAKARSPPPGH